MKHKSNKIKTAKEAGTKTNSPKKTSRKDVNPTLKWLILGGLAIITFVVFYPMLQNQFTGWDDPDYIIKNTRMHNLSSENIKFFFTQPYALNYHPFTFISLGFNYYFSKLNPYSYYLVNLTIHLLNVLLVFWFVYLLGKKNIHVATFVALVFAIHPMHVESVAWAAERKDVLYTFFFVAGLITWIYYLDSKKMIWFIATFLLALFSMFSKPAAIIFPLAIMAIEYYRDGKFAIRSSLNKIPFFLLAAFFLYMTLVAQTQKDYVVGDFKTYGYGQRIIFACYGFIIYIIKFFVPYHLAAFHPYPKETGALIYASPLLVIGLITAIYFLKEKRKLLIFGLLFYFVNIVLVIQFFSVGDAIYAERYTYVPYIGLAFVIGMIVFDEKFRIKPNVTWAVLGFCCAGLAYGTNERVKLWHNDETIWTDEIEKYPECYMGYYNRGNYYADKKQYDKAIADLTNAVKADNDYYKIYTHRGLVYYKLKKYEEALQDFNIAVPLMPKEQEAYLDRGHVYADMLPPKYEEAMKDANMAIELKPGYESYFLRGKIYKLMEKYDESIADFSKAATYNDNLDIYKNKADVYFQSGNYQKAIEQLTIVIDKNPNDVGTISNRAAVNFQSNNFDAAIADYNKAISLGANAGDNYRNLAFVYEKKGDKASAKEYANKAMAAGLTFPPDFMEKLK